MADTPWYLLTPTTASKTAIKMLKKGNALILMLAVLLTVGCGKEDANNDPKPNNSTGNITGQRTCVLVSTQSYNLEDAWRFFFNAQGQIIKALKGTSNNGLQLITYSATGKIKNVRRYRMPAKEIQESSFYQYNSDSLLSRETIFIPATPGDSASLYAVRENYFEYDPGKRLVKITSFLLTQPGGSDGYITFTYNPDGSLLEERFGGIPSQLGWRKKTKFVSGKAPAEKQAFLNLPSMFLYSSHGIVFNRLPATIEETQYSSNGVGHTSIFNYSYLFNTDGYPTEQIMTFPGQQPLTNYWTYNCP
ncbi:hypothetical protein [Adhaeribacter soli]|uniref:DUF4595 domain-containing protein n=1 Tax=Adhaeribacter soli TaxID=2607655 RepID=A0A5N1J687_9BACT|nr:hypothetical protein [Adhaeribacter soli]KAA9340212.1 hypothetical protein F0P94_07645 [Adhaeribacter soli]